MNSQDITNRVLFGAALPLLVSLGMLVPGCAAEPQSMRSAASVPASEGTVKATKGDNDNTKLAIRVKNLALPSRVAKGATTYVVWLQSDGETRMQNVGGLEVGEDLVGSLDTVTPYKTFLVVVTPEASMQAMEPTNDAVFSSRVQRAD